jgi:glycosyltransferase involved in cell wall biosynthesis
MKTALLISTYNWPDSLDLVLRSFMSQTILPYEVLIADDGSNQETKQLILEFQKTSTIPIQHFWQEDIGFRKSKILNKAVAGTTAEYIIQIDGDCIMHPRFIEDHINFACKGVYLYGSRVNILPDFVTNVFENKIIKFNLFSKEIKNRTRTLHFPLLSKLYKSHEGISKKFRGCNVSFWREDFISINGYNEDYEGWGREDSDLAIRLGNNGIKARRLRYSGIVYHIHHKINSKHNFELNDEMQNESIIKKNTFIENGVSKYI